MGVIDLAYPLKAGGSKLDDVELRLSLRSVAANLKMPIGQLFIFGYMPPWLQGAVHVPMTDKRDKALNLREKYRAMCASAELSDPFLLLDDDHIFLEPTTEIPLHTKGSLRTLAREYAGNAHGRYLSGALNCLERAKLPTRNYQIHYPLLIHKPILRAAVALMHSPMVMGSLYGNLLDGPTVEVTHDFRTNTPAEWAERSVGPFISLPPRAKPAWIAFLLDRFPATSRWESRPVPAFVETLVGAAA